MKTQLQWKTSFFKLSALVLFFFCLSGNVNAQEKCSVDFAWEIDANNPLLVHFCGGGFFVHGSFSYTCVWDFGDGFFSNDSCIDHTYALPGTYFVCQHASMCVGGGMSCHDSICKYVNVGMAATAIDEGVNSQHLKVFYNKSSRNILINYNQPVVFTLFDAAGRIAKEVRLDEGVHEVDMENVDGIYFYSISNKSGEKIEAGKLMVN